MLRLIDTFSGIGGFSYAAERIVGGFETVAFVECEPFCQKVLQKHWPLVDLYDDIKTYSPEPYSADVICAGFPCQDISVAGRQAGIKQGTRSGLFYELIRVIRQLRPQYVVLENVAAITTNGLDIVLGEMAEAGYDTEWSCIRASDMGGCHRRDRWWLVAYLHSSRAQGLRPERQLREAREEVSPKWRTGPELLSPAWRSYLSQPLLHRGDDGLSNRVDRLRSLGNTVVPQVAAIPLQRIKDIHFGRSI